MLYSLLAVGAGGAIGAVARALLVSALPVLAVRDVPLTIILVNMLGCFIMGMIAEFASFYYLFASTIAKSFLITGLLGGFTTFSAFSLECGTLIKKNLYLLALIYVFFSFSFAMLGFFSGVKIARTLLGIIGNN